MSKCSSSRRIFAMMCERRSWFSFLLQLAARSAVVSVRRSSTPTTAYMLKPELVLFPTNCNEGILSTGSRSSSHALVDDAAASRIAQPRNLGARFDFVRSSASKCRTASHISSYVFMSYLGVLSRKILDPANPITVCEHPGETMTFRSKFHVQSPNIIKILGARQ